MICIIRNFERTWDLCLWKILKLIRFLLLTPIFITVVMETCYKFLIFWSNWIQLLVQHDICLSLLPDAWGGIIQEQNSWFFFHVFIWWFLHDCILFLKLMCVNYSNCWTLFIVMKHTVTSKCFRWSFNWLFSYLRNGTKWKHQKSNKAKKNLFSCLCDKVKDPFHVIRCIGHMGLSPIFL